MIHPEGVLNVTQKKKEFWIGFAAGGIATGVIGVILLAILLL